MVKQSSTTEVVVDTSHMHVRRSGSKSSQWRNFMSSNLADMYKNVSSDGPENTSNSDDEEMDVRKILKEIEYLGSSNMSWKERKALENQKVVALGGKPPTKHRLPLSVAKVPMKKQKLREEKRLQEDMLLGVYQKKRTDDRSERRRPEDSPLISSEGYFKKGVLNVKHLLGSNRPKNGVHNCADDRKKKGKWGKKKKMMKGKNKNRKKKKP